LPDFHQIKPFGGAVVPYVPPPPTPVLVALIENIPLNVKR